MIDTQSEVRAHYSAPDLTGRIKSALSTVVPEGQLLTVDELAPIDQFHIRGMLATAELASVSRVEPSTRVLDVGCGIGGPARSLAAMFGCNVTGVDLSPDFIDAANYLTLRCGISGRVTFQVGDALRLPFEDGSYDVLLLQHVAMNIQDRRALYSEVVRVLAPGGQFVTYDLILNKGDVSYPVPWARYSSTSFLLSERDTRAALEQAGFTPTLWRDDTEIAIEWFKITMAEPPASGLSLRLVMGPDFREMAANLALNLRENRLALLSAVLERN